MGNRVTVLIEKMRFEQMLRKDRLRTLVISSALIFLIAVNIVVNSAVLPAFAAERVLTCTQTEHTHSDACYTLAARSDAERLGCKIGLHYHGVSCLDASGKLVCGKADYIIHSHNEYCYDANGELVCSLAGKCVVAHSHSAACYDSNGKLTCTLPEVKAHTHAKSCYTVSATSGTDTVLSCTQLEVKVHEHSASCVDESKPTQKNELICTTEEHTHGDDCYELKTADNTDTSSAVSSADVLSGSDEPSEMSILFNSLLLSDSPALFSARSSNDLQLDTKLEKDISGNTRIYLTFTPEYSHSYTFKFTYSGYSCNVYLNDENNSQISSGYTSGTYTWLLGGGKTYTLDVYNRYSSQSSFTVTPSVADSNHTFVDGECPCGLREDELGGSCGENASWSFKDGVLTITGTGTMTNFSSGGAPWYNIRSSIEKVVISDGITSIGNYAFDGFTALPSIDIPDSVTSVGSYAFRNCTSLADVDIPDSVTSIGSYAFYGCNALDNVVIPDGVTTISNYTFQNCTSLTNITLPDNLTSIGSYAFYGCSALPSIDIPESVTSIGTYAFQDCKLLDNVVLPDGVTTISSYAFRNCTSLTNITLPDNLTSIGSYAFYGCSSLTSIDIPESVTSIGSYAFYGCTLLDNVVIPDGVKAINSYTFQNCTSLTNVTIPDSVTSIGTYAFYGCSALPSIDIPENVTSIGTYAFYDCKLLDNVVIPDGVTTISSYTFYNCTSLTNITIPDSITSIGTYAFRYCSALESIDIPESVTSIGTYAFANCTSLDDVVVPDGVTTINSSTFYYCSSLTDITIPDSVTSIGSSAFYGCSILPEIDIPDSVTSIGSSAFRDCKELNDVVIPDGVTTISDYLFYGCTSLDSIDMPDGATSIGQYAFYNCPSLPEVDIPDGVTTIGSYAFYNDPLINSLYLPEALTTANGYLINGLDGAEIYVDSANLTSVNSSMVYNKEKVEKVTIGNKVNTISTALVDYISQLPGLDLLDFVGENFFTLDKDMTVGALDTTIKAGDYFVDANGVLYRLDKENGTVALYYVPGDVTECTIIDKTAADEDGTVYTVTSVASNALVAADSLTTLDFAAPEAILSLPSGALANCPTLESVNGATTVDDAYATFTNPAALKAEQVFYNTGLEEDVTVVDDELAIFGNDADLIPLIKVITQKNDGENNEEFADTYTYYTGEYAKVTVGISNANAGDYEVIRVYFAFDSDGGQLSWPFGTQTFESDKGTEYDIKTVHSDIENVYYIECPRLADGDTISAHINTLYPSPTTEGGKLRIWPVVLSKSDLERVGNGVVDTETCNEVEWVTKPDDFKLTKSVMSRGSGCCVATKDGETFVANLGYYVNFSRTGDTLQGMGKDHITSVEYTDTITLPDGLEWDEDVINALSSGKVRCTVNSSSSSYAYIYITVDGKEQEFGYLYNNNYSNAPITSLSIGLTDEGKVQMNWTVTNKNVNVNELNNTQFSIYLNRGNNSSYSVHGSSFSPSYINCTSPAAGQKYTIHNDVDALQHFSYSEDQYDAAEVDREFVTGNAEFLIDKSLYNYGSTSYLFWGRPANYRIRVSNKSPFAYPDLVNVNDPLADELYIAPADIQKMFDEFLQKTDYLKELSIKITTATLCGDTADAHTPGATVTAADGTEHTLTQANSGVGTLYHGCEDPDPGEYSTDATLILTCTADGTQTLTYGDSVLDASNILAALEAVGYVVTADCRYEVDWSFIDDYDLPPGIEHTFYIYSSFKDSFMLLNDDEPNLRQESTHLLPYNYGSVWYKDGSTGELVEKNASASSYTFKRDFSLYKSAIINGDSALSSVVNGDVIDYTLTVNHYGGAAYEILPLTDHMQGAQVALVPAEGNEHLATQYGLTAQDIDGESMYAINKVGTYNDINIGGMIADSITVTAVDGGGFDTVIHWYLTDITNTTSAKTKYVTFKALVDTQTTGVDGLTYSLTNETWLNDHQSHRLWSPVGTDGAIGGTGVDFDKFIVTEKGATPDTDVLATYEPFNEGEPTLYRLTLASVGDSATISGDDLFDSLPQTFHDAFVWSKDNISLRYEPAAGSSFSFTGVDNSEATWYIDSVPPAWTGIGEHEDQQYIRWSSDMNLTISGTLYIYVTLQLPDGDTWLDNAIKYRETRLENSFYVLEEKKTVYHDLASITEAYLQKGVWDTGIHGWSYSSQRCNYRRTTPDARQYFYNSSDLTAQLVSYYITLYNSGTTRLYLNTIQDALPKGVKPWYSQNSTSDYSSTNTSYYKQWTSGNVNITDEDGNKLSPVWMNFNTDVFYDAETNVMNFDLSGGNLRYDSYFGKYYLAPNEGVRLIMPCYVNTREYTEEHITNTVAMPYFDYLAAGVTVSDDTVELNNNSNGISGAALNDGVCELMDTAEANLLGMTGGNVGTQWLSSDVTLRRGQIVPGITKWVESLTTPGGSTVMETETAGTDDTVNWAVKLTNTGSDDISVWRFSDVVNPDYGFVGDVKMVYKDLYTTRTKTLFNIERDKADLDNITIKYTASSSSTLTPVSLVRGGDAVTFKVYWHPGYVGEIYRGIYIDLSVRMYVDENGNEVLAFDVLNPNIVITAGGEVTVKLSTKIYGTWANKVYYNNAYLTPLTQSYDDTRVSQGNHLLFGDNFDPSVRNSAQITAAYGYVTSSEKRIREIGNETNCASSKDEKNWIFLDEHADTFRYTNIVNNITGKPLSKFIMIDNLPEVGDHATFAENEDRYSAFKVELLDDPNFEVLINLKGTKTKLESNQYTIMYSDRTEFAEKDWDGTSDSGWYTSPKKSTRSFRLEIYDNTGLVIPDQASIHAEYNGRIVMAADYTDDEVTTDPEEGTIAWNSFGYHYSVLGENISLEAAPLKVGICIQYIPLIQKSLAYPDGSEYIAEEDASFRFILYSGTQLTSLNGKTESQIAATLKSNNRKVTVVDLTVKAGESKSDVLRLDAQKVMNYDTATDTWVETDAKWSFVDGESFTVLELDNAADMYDVQSIATSLSGSYTSAFNGQTLTNIIAVNERRSWSVRINKTDDAEGKALAGATFGIYSPLQDEQISDKAYAALTLDHDPDKTIRHNGSIWYLSQVVTTGSGGAAIFNGLLEDNYIVCELQAPGGYKLAKDIHEFALSDTDSTLVIAKDVVNTADYELPKTGTAGTTMMIVLGNLMMLTAAAVLILRKRLPKLKSLWLQVKRNEQR